MNTNIIAAHLVGFLARMKKRTETTNKKPRNL